MFGIAELLEKWEQDAARMDDYEDTRGAAFARRHMAELREAVRAEENVLLTYAEAERVSRYSERHLRHLRDTGELPDHGKPGAPRFRRGDLPIKDGPPVISAATPEAIASDILESVRSEH